MASLAQHNSDCLKLLGESFENVNRWMDEYFNQYGPTHRKFRHHREGIEEARQLFGDRAAKAAAIHVLRDCRQIPRKQDYDLGYVDPLGLKRSWSTAAYIKYSQEDFESLVEQLLKPSALVLWSFIDPPNVQLFLSSLTRLEPKEIEGMTVRWQEAAAKRQSLPPLDQNQPKILAAESASREVSEYFSRMRQTPLFGAISSLQEATFAFVPVDQLINPLVLIDFEYLDSLKPELQSTDDLEVARFAMPETLAVPVKAIADPTQRNITFVSNEKTLTVSPMQVTQTDQGTEVKFIVAGNLSMLMVANHSGRLILRNGIHRAFLLAKMGVKSVPCILINDEGPIPNLPNVAYPTFTSSVLGQPRPPLLIDFFDAELCLEVPLLRTHKLIRISADETIIPVD
jgi:hypothetical protein